jgi:hypothetical protein
MTLAEEKAFLTRFAKAAGAGELLNIHDLKVPHLSLRLFFDGRRPRYAFPVLTEYSRPNM